MLLYTIYIVYMLVVQVHLVVKSYMPPCPFSSCNVLLMLMLLTLSFYFVLLLSFILFIFFVLLLLIICFIAIFLSCSCWWYYNIYIFCYPQPPTLLPCLHVLCNATYIRGSVNLFMEATSCPKLCNNFFFPLSNIETLFNNIQFQATTTLYTLFTFFCETWIWIVKFGFA